MSAHCTGTASAHLFLFPKRCNSNIHCVQRSQDLFLGQVLYYQIVLVPYVHVHVLVFAGVVFVYGALVLVLGHILLVLVDAVFLHVHLCVVFVNVLLVVPPIKTCESLVMCYLYGRYLQPCLTVQS